MEWISVKDRLPDEHQWIILASYEYQIVTFGIFLDGKFVDPELHNSEIKEVTHWMPLPEAPK